MENIEMKQGIVINSVEVADMVGKPHNDLMKDIRRYIVQFGEGNLSHSDYFTESEYISEQNKRLSCFLVTKKGCEFIAHKLTGAKGTAFTVKYIDRFHEMEGRMADGQMCMPTGKQLMALAVLEAQKTIADQNQAIERMRPKEIFADAVMLLLSWIVTNLLSYAVTNLSDKSACICQKNISNRLIALFMRIPHGCQGRQRRLYSLDSHVEYAYTLAAIDKLESK